MRKTGTAGQPVSVRLSSFISRLPFLVGDTFDTATSVSYRQVTASTSCTTMPRDSFLRYSMSIVRRCEVLSCHGLEYLLGGTQRILVQMFDVHSFSEISDAHKYAQSLVRKADGMGNVVAFPTLNSPVPKRSVAGTPQGRCEGFWSPAACVGPTRCPILARTWAKWARSHFGQCPVQMRFRLNVRLHHILGIGRFTTPFICPRCDRDFPKAASGLSYGFIVVQ